MSVTQQLCSQLTVNGAPCRNYAMRGGDRCSAHMGIVGRKSMLSDELTVQLLQMLRAGNYIAVACRAVGISRQTLHEWLTRGASELPEDEPYRELREAVAQARSEGEVRNVARIAHAAAENWQAAAWLLERQYPERWGRTSVRLRDDTQETTEQADEPLDAFAEVDELAEHRRKRLGA